jgi:putative flippase GtrA
VSSRPPEPAAEAPHRSSPFVRVASFVRDKVGHLLHELAKFGVVGGVAFVVDVAVFNLLLFHTSGALHGKPVTAKAVSTVVATIVSYVGNRFWTFRHRESSGSAREYTLFFLLNGVGLLITEACLAFSHYVLGLDSQLADNISANIVGVGLAMLFRFWAYRRWVFPEIPDDDALTAELRQPV